ncbi:hypothetical protein GCM10027277_17150 [Pseudoduganella ginsengisoli]|uniref:Type 4a pilus biogenesis protein PilO n=1 Tax=Pseudoduganella ginsengisoli TaxID=1462440 RepID=A0A6L6PU30_9BURK|nr:hypothetical protein [Pseudoduganella ginsengisoli]MTW01023.1 hypothetical protein [Pseudoduganella ginsengisoli]
MAAVTSLAPRAKWEARRAARRLGAPAAAGVTALACALSMLWHTQVLTQQLPTLQAHLAAATRTAAQPVAAPPTAADGLAAFYRHLPAYAAIPEQLQTLVKIADQHHVPLAKAEYKPQAEPRAGFMRYQINLPVKADYAAVQAFMLEALQAMPALTLDSVAFKRERSDSTMVEARIQFILLVRSQP